MSNATAKQMELILDMYRVLDTEMDFGTIGKKKSYNVSEASKLIFLNKDIYFGIIDEGQCTVRQYNALTKIAGRVPNIPRHLIGYSTAFEWIKKYSRKAA